MMINDFFLKQQNLQTNKNKKSQITNAIFKRLLGDEEMNRDFLVCDSETADGAAEVEDNTFLSLLLYTLFHTGNTGNQQRAQF